MPKIDRRYDAQALHGINRVTKPSGHTKWRAKIEVDHKRYHLGYYPSPVLAAIAYDKMAIRLLGERARLNFNHRGK